MAGTILTCQMKVTYLSLQARLALVCGRVAMATPLQCHCMYGNALAYARDILISGGLFLVYVVSLWHQLIVWARQ